MSLIKKAAIWCVPFSVLIGLVACSSRFSVKGAEDAALTSQTLVGFASVPVTDARSQIIQQAKNLSVGEVHQYPYGSQIVDSQGNLKVNISLGTTQRIYSLMNNSEAAADAELVGHQDRYFQLARDSIRRDLSDWYMSTVSASGLGQIGEVWAPVYDVYNKTSNLSTLKINPKLNLIAYRSYQSIQPTSLYTGDTTFITTKLSNAKRDKNLYWFSLPDGNPEVVQLYLEHAQVYLYAPLSAKVYKLQHLERVRPQTNRVHKFEYQGQPVDIIEVEEHNENF
jgi:hypothetical protein